MRVTSSTFRTVLITALVGLAASVTATVVTATGAGAATCSDVDVAFARGTGEAAGLGITGGPFVSSLKTALSGKTVSSYAVNYAAAADQSSAGAGGTDMSSHVSSVAASCPGTVFVIGGYSQGASVTDVAIGIQSGGTAIPANLSGRVAAVVTFGNPLGMRGKTVATASTVYGPKSKDYCNTGDPVCGGGNDVSAHLTYASNGSTTAGAQFAAGLVKGGTTTTPPVTAPTTPPVTAPTPPVTAPTPPVTAPTTPATPTGTCVKASTSKQISDGRAFSMFGLAFAKGSRTFLGMASPFVKVSLSQVDATTWKKVASC